MDSHFPHNLVRETILWEMLALFDYCSLLSSCVSCPFPPVSSHYAELLRLKDEGSEGRESVFHNTVYCILW